MSERKRTVKAILERKRQNCLQQKMLDWDSISAEEKQKVLAAEKVYGEYLCLHRETGRPLFQGITPAELKVWREGEEIRAKHLKVREMTET